MDIRKERLLIDGQIEHMKSKGILFNIVSEEEAKNYLLNNNYYFRLKSYAKNYDKYMNGENIGKYLHLEFAYLKELAVIDMQLRAIILSITQDIEHYIKKQLINDLTNETSEDGYSIIKEVFTEEDIQNICTEKIRKNVCRDLILKYKDGWAVWNIVEILSFSQTIKLYEYFYNKYAEKKFNNIKELLYSVRYLRNATAHNNCLLNSIKKGYTSDREIINKSVYDSLCNTALISPKEDVRNEAVSGNYCVTTSRLRSWMSNSVIHDFVITIIAYKKVVSSEELKIYRLTKLMEFFQTRVLENRGYFTQNQALATAYKFVKKYLDFSMGEYI